LQVNISPDIEDAWSSLSESEMRIETRRFGPFTLRLGVGGTALAPLYQPAKKRCVALNLSASAGEPLSKRTSHGPNPTDLIAIGARLPTPKDPCHHQEGSDS